MKPRLEQLRHEVKEQRQPKIEDSPYLRHKRQNNPGGLASVNAVCEYHSEWMPPEHDFSRNSKNANFFHHMKFTSSPDREKAPDDDELLTNQRFNLLRGHILGEEKANNKYLSPLARTQNERIVAIPEERAVPFVASSDSRSLIGGNSAGGLSHVPSASSLNLSGVLSSVPSTNQLSTVSTEASAAISLYSSSSGELYSKPGTAPQKKKPLLPVPLSTCSKAYYCTYRKQKGDDGPVTSSRALSESKWLKPHRKRQRPGTSSSSSAVLGFRSEAMQRMQANRGEPVLSPGLGGLAISKADSVDQDHPIEDQSELVIMGGSESGSRKASEDAVFPVLPKSPRSQKLAAQNQRASALTRRGTLLGLGKPIDNTGTASGSLSSCLGAESLVLPGSDPSSVVLGVGSRTGLPNRGSVTGKRARGSLTARGSLSRQLAQTLCGTIDDLSEMTVEPITL
jgi:hypothetical protein